MTLESASFLPPSLSSHDHANSGEGSAPSSLSQTRPREGSGVEHPCDCFEVPKCLVSNTRMLTLSSLARLGPLSTADSVCFQLLGGVIISNLLGPGKCVRRQLRHPIYSSSPGCDSQRRPYPCPSCRPLGVCSPRPPGGQGRSCFLIQPASLRVALPKQGSDGDGGLGESWVREHRGVTARALEPAGLG